ncbi:30S ribosomal protein S3 [bacterium]
MGQKVHPKSLRVGYISDWESKWFAKKNYPDLLEEDLRIRAYVFKNHKAAGISHVGIERAGKYVRVNIQTARPGIVIGKKGSDVENLRKKLEDITMQKTYVNIIEVKIPEMDAQLVSSGIAVQLEKKVAYRRALKRAIERSLKMGALGIKIMVSGRLGGSEIARSEWLREGRVPLHTFRADIDYGFTEAFTTYGQIGVKVWIFKKEYFESKDFNIQTDDSLKSAEFTGSNNKNTEGEGTNNVNAKKS